jgi:transcriptional regulator with XRE-family HTH domain
VHLLYGIGAFRRQNLVHDRPVMLEQAIKDRMKSLGLTAYAAGKMSVMSPTMIQRFLNGQRGLTLKTADKLAKALDLVLMIKPGSTLAMDLVRDQAAKDESKHRGDD